MTSPNRDYTNYMLQPWPTSIALTAHDIRLFKPCCRPVTSPMNGSTDEFGCPTAQSETPPFRRSLRLAMGAADCPGSIRKTRTRTTDSGRLAELRSGRGPAHRPAAQPADATSRATRRHAYLPRPCAHACAARTRWRINVVNRLACQLVDAATLASSPSRRSILTHPVDPTRGLPGEKDLVVDGAVL